MDTTVADPLLGALVDGRYRVRSRVARGGMATVYSALDERLERTVALKIIHPSQSHDAFFVERFNDEAKTIARLTHPNVVAVYDQGTHEGLPYLVMEYVRGRTLRELLAERRRLQPMEALAIMEQMLAAIAAAHRAGLVHRDVKPENVLVAEAPGGGHNLIDGVVKVADFGLARAVEASADENGAHLMATVAYVAPELVTEGHADPRTDVYSAGIVLFEMLTGRVPYEGARPVEVAWQHVDRDVPPPSHFTPGLPGVLDDLVARATRRDPGGRPTDAGAMMAEVAAAREDIGVAMAQRRGPIAQPTVIVPQIESVPQVYQTADTRPNWSRLNPPPRPRRRREAPSRTGGIVDYFRRVSANPRGRVTLIAALLTLGLLIAVGGYWFGIGRYTSAPDLLPYDKATATQRAKLLGFKLKFTEQFSDTQPKDKIIGQDPGANERVLKGGTITLTVSRGPEVYPVPDIVGKAFDLATQDLQTIRVKWTRTDKYDDTIPAGSVVDTNPKVGQPIRPNSTLQVFVSKGPNPIQVPNVIGKNIEDAKNQLAQVGIQADHIQITQIDSQKQQGEVVQQDPSGGSVQDGMVIKLSISNGPPLVTLPDYTGQQVDAARADLQSKGLQVQVFGFGTVRNQNPGPNTQVPPGTTVQLFAAF
jgi:serine/threonine-protein kinase